MVVKKNFWEENRHVGGDGDVLENENENGGHRGDEAFLCFVGG